MEVLPQDRAAQQVAIETVNPGFRPVDRRFALPGRVALGLLLATLASAAGWSNLDADWIAGDEYLFLVHNPDVTGEGASAPLGDRLVSIFLHAHGDLYQPIPIATYALEWSLWGADRVRGIRRTDVLLHALNTVLLWLAIERLLRRLSPTGGSGSDSPPAHLLAASVAALWALHPALAPAYAADMGRTHLLSAGFALGSLLFHLRAIDSRGAGDFSGGMLMLAGAMLCKPLAGWFLLVFALEAAILGPQAALRSPRFWLTTLLCGGFAALTLATSRQAGILEDVEIALFGDPLTRSLLGAWLYLSHLMWPIGLSTWYPPDIRTNWSSPLVWAGACFVLASVATTGWSAGRSRLRGVAIGVVWFWAGLLPVIGLVGARVAAAQDRYLYVPAMGAALALAFVLRAALDGRAVAPAGPRTGRWKGLLLGAPGLIGLLLLPVTRADAHDARITLRRAQRSATLDPDDPRRIEFVAIAYRFHQFHPAARPPGQPGPDYATLSLACLREAVEAAEQFPRYFRDEADRAAFHRRISFRLTEYGAYEDALRQALRAADFELDHPRTLTRLAHAYRHLHRWEDARLTYERLAEHMPDDPEQVGLRWTEYGDLLLNVYERPDLAEAKYLQALSTGRSSYRVELGLARIDVLMHDGMKGFVWGMSRLEQDPEDLEASLVVALYHLRKQQWPEARGAYAYVLDRNPIEYEALRGFLVACIHTGDWEYTVTSWRRAVEQEPSNPVFRSFLVLTLACTGDAGARAAGEALLADDPRNQLAAFALALDELRAGRVDESIVWARRAGAGTELPRGNALARAAEWLERVAERESLSPEHRLVRAVLLAGCGRREEAGALLAEYRALPRDARWEVLLGSLTEEFEPANSRP